MSRRTQLICKKYAQMTQVRGPRRSSPDQPRKPMEIRQQNAPRYSDTTEGFGSAVDVMRSMYPAMRGKNCEKRARCLILRPHKQ